MAGNREYKSDVFSMLMEDKVNAMQVYNAVNGSDYDDPELVEICNLDRGVSLTIRNDAAFFLDASLSIYEHQSSICPNMPVRSLVYFTNILEKMIKDRNIYGRKLIRIPVPKFVVFYNGDEEQPEQYDMRLSDAFEQHVEQPELELICRVYNINNGKNKELLDRCPVMRDYMTFVDYVRFYHKENGREQLEHSIEQAIDRCISEGVLKDFLIERRSEVVKMMQLDYTFERQLTLERQDSREEGRAEGRAEGREEGRAEGREEGRSQGELKKLILLISKKKAKNCSVSDTADMLETDCELVQKVYDALEIYDADSQWEDIIKLILND
jgi:hypothetical protein